MTPDVCSSKSVARSGAHTLDDEGAKGEPQTWRYSAMISSEPCLHPIKMSVPNNKYDVLRPQGVIWNILLGDVR